MVFKVQGFTPKWITPGEFTERKELTRKYCINPNLKAITVRFDAKDFRFTPKTVSKEYHSYKLKGPGLKVVAGILGNGKWSYVSAPYKAATADATAFQRFNRIAFKAILPT